MGKREQRQRREAARSLAEHMLENQVKPQRAAGELRSQGLDVDIAMVAIGPQEFDGYTFTVTCTGCGRTAKFNRDPGVKVGLCPDCMRAGGIID